MTQFKKLCNKTATQLQEDRNLVYKIARFQFEQIMKSIKDLDDTRDILINKLFKFKLKTRYKNNKSLKYTAHGK